MSSNVSVELTNTTSIVISIELIQEGRNLTNPIRRENGVVSEVRSNLWQTDKRWDS